MLLLEGLCLLVSKISFNNHKKYCHLALHVQHFKNIECINESFTDTAEQRSTKRLNGKSLSDLLLPNGTTLEGFTPISRAIFTAQKI